MRAEHQDDFKTMFKDFLYGKYYFKTFQKIFIFTINILKTFLSLLKYLRPVQGSTPFLKHSEEDVHSPSYKYALCDSILQRVPAGWSAKPPKSQKLSDCPVVGSKQCIVKSSEPWDDKGRTSMQQTMLMNAKFQCFDSKYSKFLKLRQSSVWILSFCKSTNFQNFDSQCNVCFWNSGPALLMHQTSGIPNASVWMLLWSEGYIDSKKL